LKFPTNGRLTRSATLWSWTNSLTHSPFQEISLPRRRKWCSSRWRIRMKKPGRRKLRTNSEISYRSARARPPLWKKPSRN